MVTTISLSAASDLVQRLSYETRPVQAVIELIWNGLDADAHHVTVTIERSESEAVSKVVVKDDGHGMSPEECKQDFGRIGGSWKPGARRTRGEQRPLHGRSGQGRLRAFALGTSVRWSTTADNTAGKRLLSVLSASSSNRSDFDLSAPSPSTEDTGTLFEAWGRQSSHLNKLTADSAHGEIAAALAPYLIAHPDVEVIFDGSRVQPQDNIEHDSTQQLRFEHDGETHEASLRIIEWKDGAERSIHLCDGEGVPVDQLDATTATDFTYSAYINWQPMHDHRNEWMLGDDTDATVVGALLIAAGHLLEAHFETRRSEQRRRLVQEWKKKKTYPYGEDEPRSDADKAERAAFDVVATSIRRHIPKEQRKQRLTLGLLKNALQHSPGDLTRALDELLGLPTEEREQLDRLLDRTSLSRLIQASSNIADRLDFIAALEHLVFDPEASGLTRERDHLHRMLERELWVFGEQYNWMISERSLTAVLDRHLELLGRTREDKQGVRKLDGSTGRVDLLLSAGATEHDRNRHLIIELKAPKITATDKELKQIKDYAKAVAGDPRFNETSTIWDFWLVTTDLDDDVRQEATQANRPRGLVYEPKLENAPASTVRVWVRNWSEIIEDATRRLSYFRDGLDHDPSLPNVLDYLARQHADVVPQGLFPDHQGPEPDASDAAEDD